MSAETELALRQQRLLLRSAALRASIAEQAVVLEAPLAIADRVHDAARWAWRERFALIGGAAVVVVVLRPRRALRVARLAWWAWRKTRRVNAWLRTAGLAAGTPATNGARPAA